MPSNNNMLGTTGQQLGIKPQRDDILDDPMFQFRQEQDALRQRQQNQQQQAYNQIAKQNAQTQMGQLQLDAGQLQLSHQQNVSRLLQDLLAQQYQSMLAGQSGQRTMSDLAMRLLDTRHNIGRQSLLDQLRVMQAQQDLNRLVDTPGSRARRLIGG